MTNSIEINSLYVYYIVWIIIDQIKTGHLYWTDGSEFNYKSDYSAFDQATYDKVIEEDLWADIYLMSNRKYYHRHFLSMVLPISIGI